MVGSKALEFLIIHWIAAILWTACGSTPLCGRLGLTSEVGGSFNQLPINTIYQKPRLASRGSRFLIGRLLSIGHTSEIISLLLLLHVARPSRSLKITPAKLLTHSVQASTASCRVGWHRSSRLWR